MKKVGLLGGSFDPIHLGHMEMAKQAKKQLNLDEVWFVVSNNTPLKNRVLSDYQDRVNMIELATYAYHKFKVCTIERDTDGKNYTIDTIFKLKKMNKNTKFFFIVGGDQVKQLDKWKDIDKLQKEVELCYFDRNGETITSNYKMKRLHMEPFPISSSEIRAGKLKYLDSNVKRYISENVLYEEVISNYMSEYRYQHSLRVADLCVELAQAHELDDDIAYLAGIYHDINKEFQYVSLEDSKGILHNLCPSLLEYSEGIWHGYMGRYVCEHYLGLHDKRVLNAIEHHILGSSNEAYAKILYIADKLEPGREYDSSSLLKVAFTDLNKGFKAVKEYQESFYNKELSK